MLLRLTPYPPHYKVRVPFGGEGLWKWLREEVTQHYYHALLDELRQDCFAFIDRVNLVSTLIRMPKNSSFHPELSIAARLGMNAYPYPSDLVRKLTPVFTELIERGYLVSTEVIKFGKFTRIKFLQMGAQSALQASL